MYISGVTPGVHNISGRLDSLTVSLLAFVSREIFHFWERGEKIVE